MKIFFFSSACIFLFSKPVHSQKYNDYLFTEYDLPAGLPSSAAGNLYKDDYGFLWISNAYGITFYNGKEFTNISQYSSDKNFYFGDFPHNFLQLDKDRLLITCSSGLYLFYYKNREVKKVSIKLNNADEYHIRIIGLNKARTKVIVKIDHDVYIVDTSFNVQKTIRCNNESNTAKIRNEYTLPYVFYYTSNQNLAYINIDNYAIDSLTIPLNQNGIVVNGQYNGCITIGNSDKIIQLNLAEKKSSKQYRSRINNLNLHFLLIH